MRSTAVLRLSSPEPFCGAVLARSAQQRSVKRHVRMTWRQGPSVSCGRAGRMALITNVEGTRPCNGDTKAGFGGRRLVFTSSKRFFWHWTTSTCVTS